MLKKFIDWILKIFTCNKCECPEKNFKNIDKSIVKNSDFKNSDKIITNSNLKYDKNVEKLDANIRENVKKDVIGKIGKKVDKTVEKKTAKDNRKLDFTLKNGILIFKNGVETIHNEQFKNNLDIVEIHFPSTLKNIEKQAFMNCINIEKIIFDKNIQGVPSIKADSFVMEVDNSQNKYDFLYLPLDSENNCNLGYAFINFINPLHIVNFYFAFKSRKWLCYNSLKECDLSFAKFQGKSELTSNFERNMNKSDDKRRIPLIFEIKNPPKIELPKKYYEMIKEYKPEFLKDINWI